MPMLIKLVELDFSWPSFNNSILGGARTFTVAGTASEFHANSPPCISVQIFISKDKTM